MEKIILSNGVEMPIIGYGVYQVSADECERCVLDAVEVGYRAIDTAQAYRNEQEVGNALRVSGIARQELFITTKIWISNGGYHDAKRSIEESLNKLQTNYVDLLLIHQPFNDYYGTYRAMEEAYRAGKVRAIGVSNFYPDRLVDLAEFSQIRPMVNQMETHVFNQQMKLRSILQQYDVKLMAWAPLAEGRNGLFTHPVLKTVGDRYGKTAAQVALRFLIQQGIAIIPKSVHRDRMVQNLDILDFELCSDDMRDIMALDQEQSLFLSHYDPAAVKMLIDLVK